MGFLKNLVSGLFNKEENAAEEERKDNGAPILDVTDKVEEEQRNSGTTLTDATDKGEEEQKDSDVPSSDASDAEEEKGPDNSAPGYDAIKDEVHRVYPDQNIVRGYTPIIKWKFGGPDPLDRIDILDGGDYWHFVTYGMSELYEKESEDKEWSGYGMEFTFKLKKDNYEDEEAELGCIAGILQELARLTFNSGEIFRPYEFIYTGQTEGIDSKCVSNITGFITIPDPQFQTLHTVNGQVDFVEFIGVTDSELLTLLNKELDVRGLYEKLGSDVTDYNRKPVI